MKSIQKYILLIIVLLLLIAGTSIAIYRVILKANNEQETIIPTIKFSYKEPDYTISSSRMTDEVGKNQENYYEFTVIPTTSGKIKLDYYIFLEEMADNNIDSKYIKVYLTDQNNNPVGRFKQSNASLYLNDLENNEENIKNVVDRQCINIDNQVIKDCENNQTLISPLTYRLRFWISDEFEIEPHINTTNNIHTSESPQYIYKFKVNILVSEK